MGGNSFSRVQGESAPPIPPSGYFPHEKWGKESVGIYFMRQCNHLSAAALARIYAPSLISVQVR